MSTAKRTSKFLPKAVLSMFLGFPPEKLVTTLNESSFKSFQTERKGKERKGKERKGKKERRKEGKEREDYRHGEFPESLCDVLLKQQQNRSRMIGSRGEPE